MDNLMSMFNPETMKNLMENEEIKKMMSDPNIMGNIKNMMGNMPNMPNMPRDNVDTGADTCCDQDEEYGCDINESSECTESGECVGSGETSDSDEIKIDDLENIEIDSNRLTVGDKIITQHLKNESYNDRKGVIEEILPNGRCVVLFDDDKKVVAIKEENLLNRYENIENID